MAWGPLRDWTIDPKGPWAWVAHDVLGFGFTSTDLDLSFSREPPEMIQDRLCPSGQSELAKPGGGTFLYI